MGTVPYNRQSTSRAFDAYFHNWEKENIAQIFSDPDEPLKGHCGTLFQITDKRMLRRWFDRKVITGRVFRYEDLQSESVAGHKSSDSSGRGLAGSLYRLGKRHTPLTHLMRKALWRKKFWNTAALNKWLDDFNPECVFLSFSNDFFILEIALYVAKKYDIPICSSTGDDYYFDGRFSMNPLYYLYHEWYKSLNRKVFRHRGTAIYIGDKIRDKYNGSFGLDGETVYLTSDIRVREFRPIPLRNMVVSYFGNIGMGRNTSICDVATAFGRIDPAIKVRVYSGMDEPRYTEVLKKHPNVEFCGRIPYAQVMAKTTESDILLVVEGMKRQDVNLSRYALSTKVADALASGCHIVGYGSSECGAIEYLENTGCVTVGHSIDELETKLRILIGDVVLQRQNYERAQSVYIANHTREASNARVERIISNLIKSYKDA